MVAVSKRTSNLFNLKVLISNVFLPWVSKMGLLGNNTRLAVIRGNNNNDNNIINGNSKSPNPKVKKVTNSLER